MENFRVPNSLIRRKVTEKIDPSSYRTEFTRDRDRVLYATAFRRLAGKTQIYTVGNDDHKRNRMTHTLEVAQISRTIAKALDLDENLAEAIALGHDFGHTPFGHAGEEMLHAIMIPNSSYVKNSPYANDYKYIENLVERECEEHKAILDYAYGFKHNIQSLRVATSLEDSYRDEKRNNAGLDLTNVTLYGMMVHSKLEYKNSEQQPNYQYECRDLWSYNVENEIPAWSFEAYVVKWADEIAQWHHDLEDALRGKALPKKTIVKTIKDLLNDKLDEYDNQLLATVEEKDYVDRNVLASLAHIIVNFFVNDIINESKKNFETLRNECGRKKFEKDEDFFLKYDEYKFSISKEKVVAFSPSVSPDSPYGIAASFEKTIKEAVHHSKNVERMNAKGAYIIRKLFQAYFSHPQQLPDGPILHLMVECNEYVNKACNNKVMSGNYTNIDTAKSEGIGKVRFDFEMLLKNPNIYVQIHLMRRICDHIASMTDHYAVEEYTNLYG